LDLDAEWDEEIGQGMGDAHKIDKAFVGGVGTADLSEQKAI
jgi:hypothetical protein